MCRAVIINVGLEGVYNETDEFMAGQIIHYPSASIPTGYLECNGATISRTTYATLFAVIGTTFGAGDGSTTFNLPDLRGEFIRGADRGRGVDSGRAVGSAQSGEVQSHRHETSSISISHTNSVSVIADIGGTGGSLYQNFSNYTGGNETRPRNVALIPIIKYS
jgi:microcystin-dependent protein